jgi:hypothetical protein
MDTKYEAVSNGLAIVSIPERPKPRHQRAGWRLPPRNLRHEEGI